MAAACDSTHSSSWLDENSMSLLPITSSSSILSISKNIYTEDEFICLTLKLTVTHSLSCARVLCLRSKDRLFPSRGRGVLLVSSTPRDVRIPRIQWLFVWRSLHSLKFRRWHSILFSVATQSWSVVHLQKWIYMYSQSVKRFFQLYTDVFGIRKKARACVYVFKISLYQNMT